MSASQLLVVTHYNREMGIPDAVFCAGDQVRLLACLSFAAVQSLLRAACCLLGWRLAGDHVGCCCVLLCHVSALLCARTLTLS